ncbi:MAG: DNA endonuclease SmrA [Idiomarina sp.]|nr:DNA endonuclease SmrA [Idiomarina sp.]
MRDNANPEPNVEEAFDELLGDDVIPLKGEKVANIRQTFAPTLAQRERQRAAAAEQQASPADDLSEFVHDWIEPSDPISWRRDGVQDGVFRSLKRGQYTPGASLNLHQLTAPQARHAVAKFVYECFENGVRNALIIHGLGKQSKPRPGLLKNLCRQWLPELQPVLAVHSARPEHGGAGCTYVMIRKNSAAKIANKERNRRR